MGDIKSGIGSGKGNAMKHTPEPINLHILAGLEMQIDILRTIADGRDKDISELRREIEAWKQSNAELQASNRKLEDENVKLRRPFWTD